MTMTPAPPDPLNNEAMQARTSSRRGNSASCLRVFVVPILFAFYGSVTFAAPTQEDVFKSISDNVGEPTDPKKFVAVLCLLAAIIVLAAVLSQRKKRAILPKVLNHPGKLLKEV